MYCKCPYIKWEIKYSPTFSVAQGFTQIPSLDYTHTFSPVVKATTIRIVLTLAVMHQWPLHQLDVNNAFLNEYLTGTVFMEQPHSYQDPRFPDHVCWLKKVLYGLNHAPRVWFQRLSSFVNNLGFVCIRADTSLFVFKWQSHILYLLVYVDDIILIGNTSCLIQWFISKLHDEFSIKDLGHLNYFLGLEVSYLLGEGGLFLTQTKYAHDILDRDGLLDSKPVSTLLSTSEYLVSIGSPFTDPTLYRSLVGALQYLTITRLDYLKW